VFIFVGSGRRIDPTAAGIRPDRARTKFVDRGLATADGGRGGRDDI